MKDTNSQSVSLCDLAFLRPKPESVYSQEEYNSSVTS